MSNQKLLQAMQANHYLTDVANELLPEALAAAGKRRQEMIEKLSGN